MRYSCFWVSVVLLIAFSCKKVITNTEPPPKPPIIQEDTNDLKNYTKDITIANWNIEWFGSAAMFSGNLDKQEVNAGKVLKYLNADLYGICEVVDTARFGHMVRSILGDEFRYTLSFYPIATGSQKLAFIYNRNIFRNVSVRPFMGLSSAAYYNFAQRFPFMLTAEVVVNNRRTIVHYILLHAKANADIASYNRRMSGSIEMKDSLDKYYNDKNFMVIGDYNDHLKGSILAGQPSPYDNFVSDDKRYNPISLPLNATGYQSTITYPNSVIDHQMVSAALAKWYITGSIKIRSDVTAVVPDFTTHNTSDHYPVSSVYRF